MTDDEDPVPLRAGGEAGPELVRALQALQELRPDPARRARVAERLAEEQTHVPNAPTKLRIDMTQLTWAALVLALIAFCWLTYRLLH